MTHKPEQLLQQIAKEIEKDPTCPLRDSRTHTVPGEGSSTAKVVFIGEAPGQDEDEQGRPFVGRSGQLLRRTIEEVGFAADDYWIGNVIKCRPPGNRDPSTEEVEHCKHYLFAQLVIIQPKVIVTLGRYSLQLLIDPDLKITKIRGQHIKKDGQLYLPTFHPSAVLRSGMELLPDFRRDIATAKKLAEHTH
jgi:uracil-DNA glycosylase family 4